MEYMKLIISAATLNTIGAGLQELPYKVANPAIQEIDKQVKAYLEQKEASHDRTSGSEIGDTDGDGDGADRNYVEQDRQVGRENPKS